MQFNTLVNSTAEKFSIDDAVGIAEVIISVIKQCQERRKMTPEEFRNQALQQPLVTKLSLRRGFRKQGFGFQESRELAAEAFEQLNDNEAASHEAFELAKDVI